MPIYSLRESDPKGELSAFPQEGPSGMDNINKVIGAVLQSVNAFKTAKINKQFREAAAKELESGTGEATYEYDPKTASYSQKVAPKKPDASGQNATMTRFRLAQQFGIDPLTGQKLAPEALAKPRFGYSSDLISMLFGGNPSDSEGDDGSGGAGVPGGLPSTAGIQVPVGPGGSQPTFMDPIDLIAQRLKSAGRNPVEVDKIVAKLRAQKDGSNGSV